MTVKSEAIVTFTCQRCSFSEERRVSNTGYTPTLFKEWTSLFAEGSGGCIGETKTSQYVNESNKVHAHICPECAKDLYAWYNARRPTKK